MSNFKKAVGILSILLVGFLGFTYEAHAGKSYIGAQYTMIDADIVDFTGVNLVAGHAFNDFLSFEMRALVSSSTEGYYGANVEIDSLWGGYVKLSMPVQADTSLYVIVGHTEAEVSASYGGYSASAKDDSTSMGFGASYSVLEAYTFTAEYIELFDDIKSFNLGMQINF